MESKLLNIWKEILGIEELALDERLQSVDGNLEHISRFIARIHDEFKVKIESDELSQALTIQSQIVLIKSKIVKKHLSQLSEKSNQEKDTVNCKIQKTTNKPNYKTTSAQKRIFFLYELDKSSLAYNIPQVVELQGILNLAKIEDTFRQLIKRHESLRTSFEVQGEEILQSVEEQVEFSLELFKSSRQEVRSVITEFVRPFDLSMAPLFRAGLIQSEESSFLIIDMHHIVSDGVSIEILVKEFVALYKDEQLPPQKITYKDFAEWQQNPKNQIDFESQKEFWLKEYAQNVENLNLPTDYLRPAMKNYEGDFIRFDLNKATTLGLKSMANKEGATMYMVLLSIYNILLSKLSNQEDIVVGSPIAGRHHHAYLEQIIGMFVCTLPLRNQPKGELSYNEFLSSLKDKTLYAIENQDYPFEDLVNDLNIRRTTNRNPLFDVSFAFQNFEFSKFELPGLNLKLDNNSLKISKFDLSLFAYESENQLSFNFEYSTELFQKSTIQRFIAYFKQLITSILMSPDQKISGISILSDNEVKDQLFDFNRTATDRKKNVTILSHFHQQVIKNPDLEAVQFKEISFSYRQLDERSNQVANSLQAKGAGSGSIIGLMVDRSPEMIIGILGILKAGSAYLPIDSQYPPKRKSYILEDSNADLLLTTKQINHEANENVKVLYIEDTTEDPVGFNDNIGQSDLCYVIYTSGSTGRPKGVKITHGSLENYCSWAANFYLKGEQAAFPLYSSISFDLTVTSVFVPLITGNKIVVFEGQDQGVLIEEVILSDLIDIIKLTPSHLKLLRDGRLLQKIPKRLKKIIVGGEVLETALAREVCMEINERVELYNEYGPTEATVGCMIYCYNGDEQTSSVPIGYPIDNTQIYVLDRYLNPIAPGVPGELYISGSGLSQGYLNNLSLTNDRFLENPFITGTQMYKTGDLATRLGDGNLLYLGRTDEQVKIRGFRIEPGEIEWYLSRYNSIAEAVVSIKGDSENQILVGYYVSHNEISKDNLHSYLSDCMPQHMIPTHFMKLEKLPLTSNGKLDRKALPDPEWTRENDHTLPSNQLEESLVAIWSELLRIDSKAVSVKASFFELGGHSIKAFHLIDKIQQAFSVRLEMADIFKNSSIQSIAKLLESSEKISISYIPRVESKKYYTASPAQKRMYYMHLLHEESTDFNITNALEINGEVNVERLKNSFQTLIERHESLRTSFELREDGVFQLINEQVQLNLEIIKQGNDKSIEQLFYDFVRPFDLSDPSLLRCGLLQHDSGNLLFVDIHHIVADGYSFSILINDFKKIYLGEELPPLHLKYVDYANWLNEEHLSVDNQKEFWRMKLSGDPPRTNLPLLQGRSVADVKKVSFKETELSGSVYENIKAFAVKSNVSDFMFLLSAYYILLYKMSGNSDIIIGSEVLGRTKPELKDVVGTFVNILPLRTEVLSETPYLDFLEEVKECVLDSFENQDFQFNQMVELIEDDESERNPIFDFYFSYATHNDADNELRELDFNPITFNKKFKGEYEFTLRLSEANNKINMTIIYSYELFDATTIQLLIGFYKNILNEILNDDQLTIDQIQLEKLTDQPI